MLSLSSPDLRRPRPPISQMCRAIKGSAVHGRLTHIYTHTLILQGSKSAKFSLIFWPHTPLSRHHFEMEQDVWNLKRTCAGSMLRFDDCLSCPHHISWSSVPASLRSLFVPSQKITQPHIVRLHWNLICWCNASPQGRGIFKIQFRSHRRSLTVCQNCNLKCRFSTPKRNEMKVHWF